MLEITRGLLVHQNVVASSRITNDLLSSSLGSTQLAYIHQTGEIGVRSRTRYLSFVKRNLTFDTHLDYSIAVNLVTIILSGALL